MRLIKKLLSCFLLISILFTQASFSVFAEKENPPILVGGAEVHKIDSAGGVYVETYWKNNSDTPIKYVYFDVLPYNAVGDVVASEIGYKTQATLKITGPVYYSASSLGKYFKVPDNSGYGHGKNRWREVSGLSTGIGWDYKEGYDFDDIDGYNLTEIGYYYYYDYIKGKNIRIRDKDTECFFQKDIWGPVWYNNTVRSVQIVGVSVEWMDGTKKSYYGDDLSQICMVRMPDEDSKQQ